MFKTMFLLKRRAELSADEFLQHWLEVHLPMVEALPGVTAIRPCPVEEASGSAIAFDAITEITWTERGAFEAALVSDAGRAAVADISSITSSHDHLVIRDLL